MRKLLPRSRRIFLAFINKESRRLTWKLFYYDRTLDLKYSYLMREYLVLLRKYSRTRSRGICLYSTRGRAMILPFKGSRLIVKKLANQGYIPGLHRASW